MAKLIKCPKCQSQLDVTSIAGGSTVQCSCGAQIRIPTGQTGQFKAAPAPPPPPANSPRKETKKRERQTDLFRKMSNVRAPGDRTPVHAGGGSRGGATAPPSNKNMVIGLCAGGAVVVIIIIAVVMNNNKSSGSTASQGSKGQDSSSPADRKNQANFYDTNTKKNQGGSPGNNTSQTSNTNSTPNTRPRTYTAPNAFEKGAAARVDPAARRTGADANQVGEAAELIKKGDSTPLLRDQDKYLGGVAECLLSDEEAIARGALSFLRDVCAADGWDDPDTHQNPMDMTYFNSAQFRADRYAMVASFYWQNPGMLNAVYGKKGAAVRAADASEAEWKKITDDLRTGGLKAIEDPTRPEYTAFQRVKAMGKPGIAKLITYITLDDLPLAKSLHGILCKLTGQNFDGPTPSTCGAVKAKWEEWLSKN